MKKQSLQIEENTKLSHTNGIASYQATLSSVPLFGTVHIINRAGKLKLLWAEVDPGSLCTIIRCKFLAVHLPNTPVDPLRKLLSTCGATPIHSLKGQWTSMPVSGIGL